MLWDSFQVDVIARGGQATRFVQSEWSSLTGIVGVRGLCVPLTCLWLACQQRGVDFVANPLKADYVEVVRRMSADYDTRGGTWDSDFPDIVLSGCGMVLENAYMVQRAANFTTELRNHISSMPGGLYFVGFLGHSADPQLPAVMGHAVGIDTRPQQAAFFDANAGKATFPNNVSTLCSFVKHWLDRYYQITSPYLIVRRYVDAPTDRPAAPSQYTFA